MKRIPEPEYMDAAEEARVYAEADFKDVNQAYVERLFTLESTADSLLALDLGVGPGDIPERIMAQRPDWQIVGLDASPAMLAFAKTRADKSGSITRLHYLVGDAKLLPFPSNTFDLVISNSILHHVADPVALWREAARTAKPGALLFMRDLLRPASAEAAQRIVNVHAGTEPQLLQEEFYRSLLAAYTSDEVKGQLLEAGLSLLHVEPASDRHIDIHGRLI